MFKRITAAFAASLMVFNMAASSFAGGDVKGSSRAQTNQLVSMLPASDVVVVADGKRFFGEALPKVLAANQKVLNDIFAKIDAMQAKTGIDLRKFDSFAAGANIGKAEGNKFNVAPVVIARGTANSATLIDAAKKASEGKSKLETVNGIAMYVVSKKDVIALAKKHSPVSANSAKHEDKIANAVDDLAFSASDPNTIVFGYASRVRETLEGRTKVSGELTGLLVKKPAGVVNFAGKMPGGMSSLLPLDNDELGANIDSINALYGAMDVANGQATISLTAVTAKSQQAADLKGTLEGLKDLGKTVLGLSKNADKKLYAKLLGNVKLTNVSNELNLDLAIPQNDLDALVGILKK
ncbi:MAG: hypothetical protein ACRD6X_14435 [Pyrinomonadaceae bacterium]